jgi:hypothetical protein
MPLPKFLHVHDKNRNVITGPVETWINIEDIARVSVVCPRTPNVNIYLRSEIANPVLISGAEAKALISRLKALKE